MHKRGLGVFALIALLLAASSGVASAAPSKSQSEHDRVVAFWTKERVAKAVPRDFVYDPATGHFAPSPRGKPSTGGGNGTTTGTSWTAGGAVLKTTGKVLFAMDGGYWVC